MADRRYDGKQTKSGYKRSGRDHSDALSTPQGQDILRRKREVIEAMGGVRYRNWDFTLDRASTLEIFHSGGPGVGLVKSGPWPIPHDADEAEIRAILIEAVVSIDGEPARSLVRFPGP